MYKRYFLCVCQNTLYISKSIHAVNMNLRTLILEECKARWKKSEVQSHLSSEVDLRKIRTREHAKL